MVGGCRMKKKKVSGSGFIIYGILVVMALMCLLPIINILALSLSSAKAIDAGKVGLWPVDFMLANYKTLIQGTTIGRSIKNSIIITVMGTFLNMVGTILAAYPLSKPYFWGRKIFLKLMVFTMLFGGGMIPTYLVVHNLGLIDSYGALWFTGLISTYNMMVMRSFFEGIPTELVESAEIDGASEWKMLMSIYLPLSKPVLATLVLFYGVAHWNSFMDVLLYINSPEKLSLSVFVQQMIQSQQALKQLGNLEGFSAADMASVASTGLRSAAVFIMILPMLCVYPFIQKYFVKGIMLGAVKG